MNLQEAFKPYLKLIIIFIILITIIIIVGFSFLFNYYKDVHKSNYYIVTCQDPITKDIYIEKYNNSLEFQNSPLICGEPRNQNYNINLTINTKHIGMYLNRTKETQLIKTPTK